MAAGLVANLLIPVIPLTTEAATNAADLIISEYIEGSGSNKAIELYNGTGETVDLSKYTVEIYTNAATEPKIPVALSGTLESGKTFIISNSGSDPVILGLTDLSNNTVANFNGDDPLVLKKNGVIIDSIGQIGTDPGTNWSANGVNTSEMTLVRKSTVTTGDTDPKDVFDPSVDWIAYPQNTFSYLGSHTMEASGPVDPKTVAAVTASSTSQYVVENTEIKLSTETAGANDLLHT